MIRFSTLFFILLLSLSACSSNTITIGWIGPLSGDFLATGNAAKSAVAFAVEEINSEGGINGRKLKVLYEDGACSRETAKSSATRLIERDVLVIIGGACSSETLAIAEVAEPAGRVVISYAASSPAITESGDYIFRTYPSDANQGYYAAKVLTDEGIDRVAILSCDGDWCTGLHDVFKHDFEAMGGTIVAERSYEQGAKDIRSKISALRSAGPELLYFIGYATSSIAGLEQMEELGWEVPVLGADTWDDPRIPADAGGAADNVRYTYVYAAVGDDFKEKLASRGADSVVGAAQAYDAVRIVAQVMRTGKTTPTEIKDALYKIGAYRGVTGPIAFDEHGDLKNAQYAIGKYFNGRIVKPK